MNIQNDMLRVKVQSCRWECLLCLRTFKSRFCYLLHCKNVHREAENDTTTSTGKSSSRPDTDQNSVIVTELNKELSRITTFEASRINTTTALQCPICKKFFSNRERILKHKIFHSKRAKNSNKKLQRNNTSSAKETGKSNDSDESRDVDGSGSKTKKLKDTNNVFEMAERTSSDLIENDANKNPTVKDKREEEQHTTLANPAVKKRGRPRKNQQAVPQNTEAEKVTHALRTSSRHRKILPDERKYLGLNPTVGIAEHRSIAQDGKEQTVMFPPDAENSTRKRGGKKKKPRECSICNKVFANRSSLREHTRIHTGEKPYICSVCEKGFIRMGHLKQHMCSHTGLWPFKCGACNKGFMNPSRVTRHMRVHSDDRPFKCDECGEGFKEPHHLTRHFFLHTGDKPYKCPICRDRYFIQAGNLKIHMKTHEGEFQDVSAAVSDVSHEIVTSSEQPAGHTGTQNHQEQQQALEGLSSVSMCKDNVEELDADTRDKGETTSEDHGHYGSKQTRESNSNQTMESTETVTTLPRNEIVLQIVPNMAPTMQIQGLQDLSSIDQELLRQFATSVAQELVQSQ